MTSSVGETVIHRTIVDHSSRGTIERANVVAVHKIAHQHQDEQRDLQDLNKKFGFYLERVKAFETNNDRLKIQLDKLKQRWGFDSEKVKEQFDPDLMSLRKRLNKVTYEQESAKLQTATAAYNASLLNQQADFENGFVVNDRNRLTLLKQQFEGSAAELEALRVQFEDKNHEVDRLKNEMKRQIDRLQVLKNELDATSLERHKIESELQTLEEQLLFLKVVQEEERKEWATLNTLSIDVRQFYRTELAQAIINIKKDFEMLATIQRQQWEEYYKNKTEEIHHQAAENRRKIEEANRLGQTEIERTAIFAAELTDSQNDRDKLKGENNDLADHLRQLEEELERVQFARKRSQFHDDQQLMALKTNTSILELEITEIHKNNVSLHTEISVFRRLIEMNEDKMKPSYLITISKSTFKRKKLKDFTSAIFIDNSGSTSSSLDSTEKSVLQAEQSIYQNIAFDYIVLWNDTAALCDKYEKIEPSGSTSPQAIFQYPSTKQAFLNSDVIVFVTDGEIDPRSVTEFSKHTKNNLNKVLIVGVIVNNKLAHPSHVNVSVIAPFMVASNVLCLFYDGRTFFVLSSKGFISKFYRSPTSLSDYNALQTLDMNELFHNIDMYEHTKLPDGFIPIRDDEQEIVALHFKQFISLTNLYEVILMEDEEWKTLIQYGKINNRLDDLRKFVIRMKEAATSSDTKAFAARIDSKYPQQQNEPATSIGSFSTNRHRTRLYWSNIENMLYSQTIGSYSLIDFTLASSRPH